MATDLIPGVHVRPMDADPRTAPPLTQTETQNALYAAREITARRLDRDGDRCMACRGALYDDGGADECPHCGAEN